MPAAPVGVLARARAAAGRARIFRRGAPGVAGTRHRRATRRSRHDRGRRQVRIAAHSLRSRHLATLARRRRDDRGRAHLWRCGRCGTSRRAGHHAHPGRADRIGGAREAGTVRRQRGRHRMGLAASDCRPTHRNPEARGARCQSRCRRSRGTDQTGADDRASVSCAANGNVRARHRIHPRSRRSRGRSRGAIRRRTRPPRPDTRADHGSAGERRSRRPPDNSRDPLAFRKRALAVAGAPTARRARITDTVLLPGRDTPDRSRCSSIGDRGEGEALAADWRQWRARRSSAPRCRACAARFANSHCPAASRCGIPPSVRSRWPAAGARRSPRDSRGSRRSRRRAGDLILYRALKLLERACARQGGAPAIRSMRLRAPAFLPLPDRPAATLLGQ